MQTPSCSFRVYVETSAQVVLPARLAPFAAIQGSLDGRPVVVIEFQADDCGFIPSGRTEIVLGKKHFVCFDPKTVRAIETVRSTEEAGVIRYNRHFCPDCLGYTLVWPSRPNAFGPVYKAACSKKGCFGSRISKSAP